MRRSGFEVSVNRLPFILLPICLLLAEPPLTSQAQVRTALTPSGLNTWISEPTTLPSGRVNYDITGGTRPSNGPNLFHSFGEFSVATNEIANFLNETSLPTTNILSRVTGGQVSNIWGTLQTTDFPGANLWLMNPAGVMFGPTAELNVSGSVNVSTADYLRLTDNVRFNAVPGLNEGPLSIAPVAAFGFTAPRPVAISIQRSVLDVPAGQTLSLIGGDITFVGDPVLGFLSAPGGQVQLASVASAGEVIPSEPGSSPDLNVDSFTSLGRIDVTQLASIDASGTRGGTIVIRGGALTVDNSFVSAHTFGATNGAGVALDIKTSSDIIIRNGATLDVFTLGAGRGGDARIAGQNVQLDAESRIATASLGVGRGGDLYIQATAVTATKNSEFAVVATSSGASGNLTVEADSIVLSDLNDNIRSPVVAGLRSETGPASSGRGGAVGIMTKTLDVRDGARINVSTRGRGAGGDLTIQADQILLTDGDGMSPGGIHLQSGLGSLGGPGGKLRLSTEILQIENGATISAKSRGGGKTGDLDITAEEIVLKGEGVGFDEFSPAGIGFIPSSIRNNPSSTGPGGNITIHADRMEILDGAQVGVQVFPGATGAGGALSLDVEQTLLVSGISKAVSVSDRGRPTTITSSTQGFGRGGPIQITAPTLELHDGGRITSETTGGVVGDAGSIAITSDKVLVSGAGDIQGGSTVDAFLGNSSAISALTNSTGKGGNVEITAKELEIRDGGVVSIEVRNDGAGGTVTIKADRVLLQETTPLSDFDRSPHITGLLSAASAGRGNGGEISIEAKSLEILNGAGISAGTASLGNAGSVTIEADQVLLARTLDLVESILPDGQTTRIGNGGSIRTNTNSSFPVEAGPIRILADAVELKGGTLDSSNFGPGKAGGIDLRARVLTMEDAFGRSSRISASTSPSPLPVAGPVNGPAGTIAIVATESFSMGRNSSIESSTRGPGAGGEVAVSAGRVLVDGGVIEAKTMSSGEGGRITLLAGQAVTMTSGALITGQSTGTGNAGDIVIDAGAQFLSTNSSVTTQASQASGGNISLFADDMIRLTNSQINTSVAGGPTTHGGDIMIDPQFVLLQNSPIVAQAFAGTGGNINILAGTFLADPNSPVSASSQLGVSGSVNIQAPIQNLSGALVPLTQEYLAAATILGHRCAAQKGGQFSSFVQGGRDGVPPQPGDLLPSPLLSAPLTTPPTTGAGLSPSLAAARLELHNGASRDMPAFTLLSGCRS